MPLRPAALEQLYVSSPSAASAAVALPAGRAGPRRRPKTVDRPLAPLGGTSSGGPDAVESAPRLERAVASGSRQSTGADNTFPVVTLPFGLRAATEVDARLANSVTSGDRQRQSRVVADPRPQETPLEDATTKVRTKDTAVMP